MGLSKLVGAWMIFTSPPLTFTHRKHICWKAGMARNLHPEAEKLLRIGNQRAGTASPLTISVAEVTEELLRERSWVRSKNEFKEK